MSDSSRFDRIETASEHVGNRPRKFADDRIDELDRIVGRINDVQDWYVTRYFDRYGITFTYLAFAFVYLFYGFQKLLGIVTPTHVPLSQYAAATGIPLSTLVVGIGVFQLVMGAAFLFQRIRAAFWLLFTYQAVSIGSILWFNNYYFQPPRIPVPFVDASIPWAITGWAGLKFKGVIFVGAFVLLASMELGDRYERTHTPTVRGWIDAGHARVVAGIERFGGPVGEALLGAKARTNAAQDRIVKDYFDPHGPAVMCVCFAFVYIVFGLQKPAPTVTPVRPPLALLATSLGLPVVLTIIFIGFYEMVMGTMFLFGNVRTAIWMFLAWIPGGFLTLVMWPYAHFQPPWITVPVVGVDVPWALTQWSIWVLKNPVFIAGAVLLASAVLGNRDRTVDAAGEAGP